MRLRVVCVGLWLLAIPMLGWAQSVRTCPEASAPDYYFPADTFSQTMPRKAKDGGSIIPAAPSNRVRDDSSGPGLYADQLRALRLTSWSCGTFGHGYRFIWLRTFDHPVSVSVVLEEKGWVLHATELNGTGDYQPGSVLRTTRIALDAETAERIRRQIETTHAWSLPTNISGLGGTDGAQWIFELREGRRYHVIDRWSPESGPVRALGLAFLALTGWHFPARDTY